MKNNLAKLFAVSSFIAGGSLMAAMPANALQISLDDRDAFNITTYGTFLEGLTGGADPAPGVINSILFDDDPTNAGEDFRPFGDSATADLTFTNIPELLANPAYADGEGVAQVFSIDITQGIVDGIFDPVGGVPGLDFVFDPDVRNEFVVPDGQEFIFAQLDIPGDPDTEDPDLVAKLLRFETFQSASLLTNDAQIGVGIEGDVEFVTFGADGQEVRLGTGSFSTTFPSNGTSSVNGTGVLSFETDVQVPESSNVFALIGLGLLGSAYALKKKVK